MKKVVLTIIVLCCYGFAFAQKNVEISEPVLPIDEDTKLITYQDVIHEKGTPQVLFDRAKIWIKDYYKNTAEIIKKEDRATGVIEMRSSVRIFTKLKDGTQQMKNIVYYQFKLECRQDRYRYTITNFNERASSASPIEVWFKKDAPLWSPSCYDYLNQVDEQIRQLIESLEEGMLPKVEKVDEW